MKTNTLDFDAQALRERILDLAMRGKLVPQDPNDEPASVLLEKIKDEKEELIKEKKIKKSKALPAITDDEKPFDIPDSWEWVRLGNILKVKSGYTLKKKELLKNGKYLVYGANGIIGNYNQWNTDKNILLISRVGFFAGNIHMTSGKCWVTDNSLIVTLSSFLNKDFFYYGLQSIKLKNDVSQTAQPVISGKKIYAKVIPLPPLSEQKRIAAKIAQLFALLRKVETFTQQYTELQTLLRSKVLNLAMRGKLVKQDPNDEPASVLLEKIKAEKAKLVKEKKIKKSKPLSPITDEEKPFDIPDSWEWVRLGEYAEKITDQVASGSFAAIRENVKKYKHEEFALMVKTADFSTNFSKNLTYTDEHGYKFLSNSNLFGGELILSNIGSIGKCFIVPNLGIPMTLAPNSIMVKVSEEHLKQFLYYFIQSPIGNAELWKITSGTTMKKFNKTGLKTILVPIPPFAEQVRIINEIKKLYKLIK